MNHNSTDWLSKKLIFVLGKGGVGKTTIARATARYLASLGKKTLLCDVLQVSEKKQQLKQITPCLWEITLNASECFREYIILKIKLKSLYTLFLGNKITQYLEKAAPGVREMVFLGKIWFERNHYDHIVIDMPSTGYALTMIHTPFNFEALFPGGPIYHDAKEMISTLSDPQQTAFVAVSLAEEMPIQETLELKHYLHSLMPLNPAWLTVNRLIRTSDDSKKLYFEKWSSLSLEERHNPLWQGLHHLITKENKQKEQLSQFADQKFLEIEEMDLSQDPEQLNGITEYFEMSGK